MPISHKASALLSFATLSIAAVTDEIDKVFIVFSNHLDVGFTDFAMYDKQDAQRESGRRLYQDDGCNFGTLTTPEHGVKGTHTWTHHVGLLGAEIPHLDAKIQAGFVSQNGRWSPEGPCCGDEFITSVENVTASGFDFKVERTNGKGNGWGQQLFLAWRAGGDACDWPTGPSKPVPVPDQGYPVLQRNWDEFIPRAIATASELQNLSGVKPGWSYKWMCHSFIADMFLGCRDAPENFVPGINNSILHCPDGDALETFEKAVRDGVINWHAFPHNGEPEMYPPDFFKTAIERTHRLDARFGRNASRTLSQRDVPGLTRAAIPLLRQAGVEAVAVGENNAAGPLEVPRIFVWEDAASGTDILALFHPGGYGSPMCNTPRVSDCAIVPAARAALCPSWCGDNKGPHDAPRALKIFRGVQEHFPNADIRASNAYDDFLDVVTPHRDTLPRLTQEIGDSWIYGASTDPVKVAQYRAGLRARRACIVDGTWDSAGHAEDAFDRLMLKPGEHTWGLSGGACKSAPWDNDGLERAINSTGFDRKCIDSWYEQRNYVLNAVLEIEALGSKCASRVAAAVAEVTPPALPFEHSGFEEVAGPVGKTFSAMGTTLAFGTHGGIVQLERAGASWASEASPLAEFVYQTLDGSTMTEFVKNYSINASENQRNFGKPGLPDLLNDQPTAGITRASLQRLLQRSSAGKMEFILELSMPDFQHEFRGAPSSVLQHVEVMGETLRVTVQMRNKTRTRIPETAWVAFMADGQAELDKMGSWLDPTDVLLSYNFSAMHLHAVDTGFRYSAPSGQQLLVETLDTALLSVGSLNPTPYSPTIPDPRGGIFASLVNNIWNTNYPFWYPFDGGKDDGQDIQYRFVLTLSDSSPVVL